MKIQKLFAVALLTVFAVGTVSPKASLENDDVASLKKEVADLRKEVETLKVNMPRFVDLEKITKDIQEEMEKEMQAAQAEMQKAMADYSEKMKSHAAKEKDVKDKAAWENERKKMEQEVQMKSQMMQQKMMAKQQEMTQKAENRIAEIKEVAAKHNVSCILPSNTVISYNKEFDITTQIEGWLMDNVKVVSKSSKKSQENTKRTAEEQATKPAADKKQKAK